MLRTSTSDHAQIARLFHALADETRLRIIECLTAGEECVCNLTDTLRTGQSRLSFHLKILKEAGILTDRREGRWMYYALNPEVLNEIADVVKALQSPMRSNKQRCCD
jgi:ArsR family transcriptional regulator, arsenate/arsenite/antimonite-responsive transcriptional repressor